MVSTSILDVRVDDVNYDEAVAKVAKMFSEPGKHQIVTINPEFIIRAQKDRDFKEILKKADLAVADGAGLNLALRLLNKPQLTRVTGVDLVEKLCEKGEKAGWRFFFLGGKGNVAENSSKLLRIRYPDLKVVGFFEGNSDPRGDDATLAAIKEAGPIDILLVAYGHPKQEKWIQRNLEKTSAKVGMGVGGSFDFLSGKTRRAPSFLRKRGLEWFYRLVSQPWRWQRQLALPQFLFLILKSKFKSN